ncbi:hypothetical protein DOW25_24020 [Salmonella enterica subsp. enterica serovar Typhimurium]|nr:hypothetical protein [Salmonella enterica subsp. enterica serovar Typhimurium]
MANLIPTMGYYACDVIRIKNLASAGFLFFLVVYSLGVKSQGGRYGVLLRFSIQAERDVVG